MARGPARFPRPQDGQAIAPDSADRSITPYADSPSGELWNRGVEPNTSDSLRADNAPALDGTDDRSLAPYGNARGRVSRGGTTRV